MAVVLLVDDDERLLSSVVRAFRIFLPECSVVTARGGNDAAIEITKYKFDVVVTDLCMADGDGDFVLALAAEKQPAALRILVSSVERHNGSPLAHHRFAKPCDLREVCDLIRSYTVGPS